ncbi:acyltransferase [Vibrio cholerae]|uniref:acyltransferase n=1 Tax=Vibrio cholerae TaxID=666 RepID=UPI000682DAA2|nr:acyltransferase [Vibrio cholerae]
MFRMLLPTSLYLKFKGVKYGNNCRFNRTIQFGSEPYLIEFGDNFYSSSNIQFVTHDGGINVIRNLYPSYRDVDLIKPIIIGNNVFIGYGCTVLPGTIIHDNVIVGANSVVRGELKSNSIYAGVPVRRISSIFDFLNKNKTEFIRTKLMSPKEKKKYLMKLKLK